MTKKIILKQGKDKPIKNRHHWIFSGAVESFPQDCAGEIVQVDSNNGECLGHAYFNPRTSIVGRMISFGNEMPHAAIERALVQACHLRTAQFSPSMTNAYRLINGEGDHLPGLIVDRYHDVLVIQLLTLGMEQLRPFILEKLILTLKPIAIYEKSTHGSRKEEGLTFREGVIHGPPIDEVEILENSLKFIVSLNQGQKTGFFLDQREMRKMVMDQSKGKRILNCFAYTGGFSVYALAGQAKVVVSVETSEHALTLADRNVAFNDFNASQHRAERRDVFEFLKQEKLDYELIILDPPAFAKGKKDLIAACRGYKEINRLALKKMPAGSLLLTCSCSGYVDADLFQKVIFQSAAEAERTVRIVSKHRLALDHPINLFHPESEYLKSLLLYVE